MDRLWFLFLILLFSHKGWAQIDPYLKPDRSGFSYFGQAVAIDGDITIAGAPFFPVKVPRSPEVPNGTVGNAGGIFIFQKNAGGSLERIYIPNPEPDKSERFGWSVALSGDTAVVGTPHDVDGGEQAGAVYVYQRSEGIWTLQARLNAPSPDAFDEFGERVAISGDTIVVAATGEDGDENSTLDEPNNGMSRAGAVYVYSRSGLEWQLEAYLKAPERSSTDKYATAVAVHDDVIAVSAPSDLYNADRTTNVSGSVHVYQKVSGEWVPGQRLHSTVKYFNGGGAGFGSSLAMKGDLLVVGNQREGGGSWSTPDRADGLPSSSGTAYIFEREGRNWVGTGYLKAMDARKSDEFGTSVATDGVNVVVGARYEDGTRFSTFLESDWDGDNNGAAYLYSKVDGVWAPRAYLKAFNSRSKDVFGTSVGISGETIVVGAPGEDGTDDPLVYSESTGAAYQFEIAPQVEKTRRAFEADYQAATSRLPADQRSFEAIPFGDGTSNFLKYAFNMNLNAPDYSLVSTDAYSGLPTIGPEVEWGKRYLSVEYVRRRNRGLIYRPLISNSLTDEDYRDFDGETLVNPVDDRWERVRLRKAWPTAPGQPGKLFFKIKVTAFD